MDIQKAIKTAVSKGDVVLGMKEIKKHAAKGKIKLVIYASNSPEKDFPGVKTYRYKGSNADLGVACGKPFPVAAIGIIDPGPSEILSLV
ncbi:MAG: 50S ribosomal protein L30e [Thermoplasmata archaeon]|nr:50S ribosomal protein L30e [Thermoplasmata archaeon]